MPVKVYLWFTRELKDFLPRAVNRHFFLRTFRLIRLESSHCLRLPKSLVRAENNSSESLEAKVRFVSSAYILTSDRRLKLRRSLIYSRNSRGSRIEP